ncbi:MAG: hypothetical protein FWH53_06855 [Leptospirales bacterium]|nr:hypothetical protein [Leptospirales bacterium]
MKLIIFTLVCLVAFSGNAYAYLDPGTGSMLLQVLAAGVIAIGVGWRSFVAFVRRKNKKNEMHEENTDKKENAPENEYTYDKHLAD